MVCYKEFDFLYIPRMNALGEANPNSSLEDHFASSARLLRQIVSTATYRCTAETLADCQQEKLQADLSSSLVPRTVTVGTYWGSVYHRRVSPGIRAHL